MPGFLTAGKQDQLFPRADRERPQLHQSATDRDRSKFVPAEMAAPGKADHHRGEVRLRRSPHGRLNRRATCRSAVNSASSHPHR